ncbi:conjugative relaxase [Thiomicrorhabdus immobilis]|uniref:Conjugative relaxase n=1 Tax=Thiomicrorhabdus immobilis TaxID=2791037 RepID=A0ABM7MBP5_9GAMM|nr:MobF family relaxase [Thiomicrorhabdus immobilis]BCN92777.1 conjugative relaxase [Thiomicrorhabdus immobilis]
MMNVTALTSAGGAAGYLTQDNYYLEKGEAAAHFYGQGAEKLGLTEQAVTNENVTALLKGELPDGSQVGKSDNHRPGWDATFSAPKSVSIQALVAGDERIQAAHDQAVKTALDHYENHITTRQRVDGKIERQITGSLVSATFQHQTSRNLDPQLHTHAVVMNVTQGQNGDWRSVSSESLYRMQRELDQVYKTELEARLNQLGYRTEKTEMGFELKSVPELVRAAFSTRATQVEAELAKHNLTRQDSTAAQRQTATLKTRQAKPTEQNRQAMFRSWQQQAKDIGWQPEPRPDNQPTQSLAQPQQALSDRVSHTIAVLTEKDAVISEGAVYRHLNGTDQPAVSKQQLADTLKQLKSEGKLHSREIGSFDRHTRLNITQPAIVTEQGRQLEKQMLSTAERMNQSQTPGWLGKVSPSLEKLALSSGYFKGGAITSPKVAAKQVDVQIALAAQKEHTWTAEQRQAAIGILSHRGNLSQLQGYAGTAKTSSVLASIRDIAKREGYTVVAIAPSHAASQQLQKDINANQALTTSGYIAKMQSGHLQKELNSNKVLVIHDESGLASTQQMKELLVQAEKSGHRLLNSGDRYQKASIGAGSAFGQLTDYKIPTYELTTIFRQKDANLKQAVEHSLPSDPKTQEAMQMLNEKGLIQQIKCPQERINTLASQYTQLTLEQRQKTLLIDPTRKGIDQLNSTIREQLQAKGELPIDQLTLNTLHTQDIAKADLEKGAVGSVFKVRQVVTLNNQALKSQDKALIKGSQWQITALNRGSNTLTVQSMQQPALEKTLAGTELARTHASVSELRDTPLSIGDEVRFTASDQQKGVLTNEAAIVKEIDEKTGELKLSKPNGQTVSLDGKQAHNIDYNYAKTTFSAQGQTAERVLYHAPSTSTNLMNQRDFYVGLSRATTEVTVVTDSKRDLSELIEKSTGEKLTALDKMHAPSRTHEKETDTQSKSDVDKIFTHAEAGSLDDKSVSEFDSKVFSSGCSAQNSSFKEEKSDDLEHD